MIEGSGYSLIVEVSDGDGNAVPGCMITGLALLVWRLIMGYAV